MSMTSSTIQPRVAGFTLIELLVVMSIIALLLSIALPRYFGSLDKAKDTVLSENLMVMRVTIDKFHADKGRYPNTLEELVEQRYLRAVPTDPFTERADTWLVLPGKDGLPGEVADVKSGAMGNSKGGRAYANY